MAQDKTVFILGAGFSIPAGAPSQYRLIQKMIELRDRPQFKPIVDDWVTQLESFLSNELCISKDRFFEVALEDIFTPIDRCILDGISFRGIENAQLPGLRNNFYSLIVLALRHSLRNGRRDYINNFSNYLVDIAKSRIGNEKIDQVSVITTNWDIALDNSLQNVIKKIPKVQNAPFAGVVDYCCHISSLKEKDELIKPGLYALGKGGFNMKLLKLHGSMNWLQCPKCQRLYVKFYANNPGGFLAHNQFCRHCRNNFNTENDRHIKLVPNMIMPTFLKDLNNFQVKLIWQNAGIELSEASIVIFIGYSLPYADFELRQLLSRMIRSDAKIEAVLHVNDNPDIVPDEFKHMTAGFRYQSFFSGRELTLNYDGVVEYINKLTNS